MRPTPITVSVPPHPPSDTEREILRRFRALPEDRLALFHLAAEIATAAGCDLYWVGGGVRDLWLGSSELDVDLVVDGELMPFAALLASRLGTGLHSHPQFMTAEINLASGIRVDLARARTECYPAPASLPVVRPGSIASDFGRRDFTINCLAIPLAPAFGDCLLDPCNGLADLLQGSLRTLHRDSFREDPTRLLRLVEFEIRFGFVTSTETLSEATRAVASGVIGALSPARLREALKRALGRPATAVRVLRRLRELHLLEAVDAGMKIGDGVQARLAAALRETGEPSGAGRSVRPAETFHLALLCLAFDLGSAERERLALRLELSAADCALVTQGPERVRRALSGLEPTTRPSAVHDLLGPLAEEELAVVATQDENARSWVRRERFEMRSLRLSIGGKELLATGVAAGPELGRALDLTLRARLDGRVGIGEELSFALQVAADGATEEDP